MSGTTRRRHGTRHRSGRAAAWRAMDGADDGVHDARARGDENAVRKHTWLSEGTCGAAGGVVAAAVVHPVDTVKTLLQTGGKATPVLHCAHDLWRAEGLRGFYRGVGFPIVSQPLYIGSCFGGVELGRRCFEDAERPAVALVAGSVLGGTAS
eukprot:4086267-Prymnesium_polylepis.1